METILGIDLGTTNSVVSVLRDKQPFVIPAEDLLDNLYEGRQDGISVFR